MAEDAIKLSVDPTSLRKALRNFERISGKMFTGKAVDLAAAVYMTELRRTMRHTDHNASALRKLGYPYARKHGSMSDPKTRGAAKVIHPRKPWIVHKQKGDLLGALRKRSIGTGRLKSVVVYIDLAEAPHAKFVIRGTIKMLERPVLDHVATDPLVQKKMLKAAVLGMKFALKTGGAGR